MSLDPKSLNCYLVSTLSAVEVFIEILLPPFAPITFDQEDALILIPTNGLIDLPRLLRPAQFSFQFSFIP